MSESTQYVKDPNFCPFCGSKSISAESLESEGTLAYQTVSCADCGEYWVNIFELVSFHPIEKT